MNLYLLLSEFHFFLFLFQVYSHGQWSQCTSSRCWTCCTACFVSAVWILVMDISRFLFCLQSRNEIFLWMIILWMKTSIFWNGILFMCTEPFFSFIFQNFPAKWLFHANLSSKTIIERLLFSIWFIGSLYHMLLRSLIWKYFNWNFVCFCFGQVFGACHWAGEKCAWEWSVSTWFLSLRWRWQSVGMARCFNRWTREHWRRWVHRWFRFW